MHSEEAAGELLGTLGSVDGMLALTKKEISGTPT